MAIGAAGLVFTVCDCILKGLRGVVAVGLVGSVALLLSGLALLDGRRLPHDAARRPSVLSRMSIAAAALMVAVGLAETAARVGPYSPFVTTLQDTLDAYRAAPSSYLMHDADLGWSPRPGSWSLNGLYRANSRGLRSDTEYEDDPPPGALRVAVFGDSFTHGDDVPLQESWPSRLEALLARSGSPVEVLNFGVGGYGMDQALLRWRRDGRRFHPHIVVLGFQPENVLRNLNMFRRFYDRSFGLPLFKPRFVLREGRLDLINSPTVSVEDVPDTVARFDRSPLAAHERFFDAADRSMFRSPSKFLHLVHSSVTRLQAVDYDYVSFYFIEGEGAQLALAIVRAFEAEVSSRHARFLVVHLPRRSDLDRYAAGAPFVHADLLVRLEREVEVIRTEMAFDSGSLDRLFVNGRIGGHYSAAGHEVVARLLASRIESED